MHGNANDSFLQMVGLKKRARHTNMHELCNVCLCVRVRACVCVEGREGVGGVESKPDFSR